MIYTRDDRIAVITKPFFCFSTHMGLKVTVVQVLVDGRVAFSAPNAETCKRWLLMTGFWPKR